MNQGEQAKIAVLGVACLAGGAGLASAFGKARKQPRIQFNPFQGDVLPVTPTQAVANTIVMGIGILIGVSGMKESLHQNGYSQDQIATIIPHGIAAAGVLSLVAMAIQSRPRDER